MKSDIPEFIYHGSITGEIKEFEPRKRYTPSEEVATKRTYASDNPCFAVMHSFPWSSEEGIDIVEKEDKLYLQIPKDLQNRLNQPIYIYKLSGDNFVLTEEENTGNTYHTEKPVKPLSVKRFSTVTEGIEYYGGAIEVL